MVSNETDDRPLTLGVAGLILGVMAVTLTLACTWMTHRKRRVGSQVLTKHGSLVMDAPPPSYITRSPKTIGVPRYTTNHDLSINRTTTHPSIIITPPTPLALLTNSSLLNSDSSIGSADDLILEDRNRHNDINSPSEKRKKNVSSVSDFCSDSLDEGIKFDNNRTPRKVESRVKTGLRRDPVFKDMQDYDHRTVINIDDTYYDNPSQKEIMNNKSDSDSDNRPNAFDSPRLVHSSSMVGGTPEVTSTAMTIMTSSTDNIMTSAVVAASEVCTSGGSRREGGGEGGGGSGNSAIAPSKTVTSLRRDDVIIIAESERKKGDNNCSTTSSMSCDKVRTKQCDIDLHLDDDDSTFDPTSCLPRSRLNSIEPGSRRSDYTFCSIGSKT